MHRPPLNLFRFNCCFGKTDGRESNIERARDPDENVDAAKASSTVCMVFEVGKLDNFNDCDAIYSE